jgi:Ca2+-binding EF-hand superfamily protein
METDMQPKIRFALLLGAVLATGVSAAVAEMNAAQPGKPHRSTGNSRASAHFMADYDANHDGKVTRDEFNRGLGQRYAAVAHGQPINAQQYAADAAKKRRDRQVQYFRHADWNGDGKLTLEEYMAPLRIRYGYADRNAAGYIDCAKTTSRLQAFGDANRGGGAQRRGHSSHGMCFLNDMNQDGKVTHAEFDAANAKRFETAAHGSKTIGFDQFASIGQSPRYSSGRTFQRLDSNGDGKLTLAEYAAPQQAMFARFDANHDQVVTRAEIAAASQSRGGPRRPAQG